MELISLYFVICEVKLLRFSRIDCVIDGTRVSLYYSDAFCCKTVYAFVAFVSDWIESVVCLESEG